MTPQIAYLLIIFLLVWTSINYSLPLVQAIIELLKELEKYAIVRKGTPVPAPTVEEKG